MYGFDRVSPIDARIGLALGRALVVYSLMQTRDVVSESFGGTNPILDSSVDLNQTVEP